jgi:hypothetical protein
MINKAHKGTLNYSLFYYVGLIRMSDHSAEIVF